MKLSIVIVKYVYSLACKYSECTSPQIQINTVFICINTPGVMHFQKREGGGGGGVCVLVCVCDYFERNHSSIWEQSAIIHTLQICL